MPTELDQLFASIVLHNKMVSKAKVDQCLKIIDQAARLGVSLTLSEVMVQRLLLARKAAAAVEKIIVERTGTRLPLSPMSRFDVTRKEDRRLGNLAVRNRLVTDAQLDECLALQQRISKVGVHKPLGELLVEKRYLKPELLEGLLAIQRSLSDQVADTVPLPPTAMQRGDLSLAAVTVQNALASPQQLQECLVLQKRLLERAGVRLSLGEILVEKGIVAESSIPALERMFRARGGPSPFASPADSLPAEQDDALLGTVVRQNELLSEEQLQACSKAQQKLRQLGFDKPLGDIFV